MSPRLVLVGVLALTRFHFSTPPTLTRFHFSTLFAIGSPKSLLLHGFPRRITTHRSLHSTRLVFSPSTNTTSSTSSTSIAKNGLDVKPSLWARVKSEVKHYWLGTKLLAKETRISSRLAWKMMRGSKLTRREHTQVWIVRLEVAL